MNESSRSILDVEPDEDDNDDIAEVIALGKIMARNVVELYKSGNVPDDDVPRGDRCEISADMTADPPVRFVMKLGEYQRKSEVQLKCLAMEISVGAQFCSATMGRDRIQHIEKIFTPLMFFSEEEERAMADAEYDVYYEHRARALPNMDAGCPGHPHTPMFSSFCVLDKVDARKVQCYLEDLKDWVEAPKKEKGN